MSRPGDDFGPYVERLFRLAHLMPSRGLSAMSVSIARACGAPLGPDDSSSVAMHPIYRLSANDEPNCPF